MRRGDAFSKSNWGGVAFFIKIHGVNILIIEERDARRVFVRLNVLSKIRKSFL